MEFNFEEVLQDIIYSNPEKSDSSESESSHVDDGPVTKKKKIELPDNLPDLELMYLLECIQPIRHLEKFFLNNYDSFDKTNRTTFLNNLVLRSFIVNSKYYIDYEVKFSYPARADSEYIQFQMEILEDIEVILTNLLQLDYMALNNDLLIVLHIFNSIINYKCFKHIKEIYLSNLFNYEFNYNNHDITDIPYGLAIKIDNDIYPFYHELCKLHPKIYTYKEAKARKITIFEKAKRILLSVLREKKANPVRRVDAIIDKRPGTQPRTPPRTPPRDNTPLAPIQSVKQNDKS